MSSEQIRYLLHIAKIHYNSIIDIIAFLNGKDHNLDNLTTATFILLHYIISSLFTTEAGKTTQYKT